MSDQALNLLILEKTDERYVFLYDDESYVETIRTFFRFAKNSELSFNWYDVVRLSSEMKKQKESRFKRKFG